MKYSNQVKPISYLKSHAAEIVTTLTETREPMLITQNGEARLVVMDVKSYEEQEQAIALLQILTHGQREIAQSRHRPLAKVLSRLNDLDAAKAP
jgi:PHD/YefM family antitoxin component YafN of YafNO toxin-antitoxin module